jgi:hypothetical protein
MTKDFGAARRNDHDPAFGKRLISIRATPPHFVRNIALATVWLAAGVVLLINMQTIAESAGASRPMDALYLWIVDAIFIVYGAALIGYSFLTRIPGIRLYERGFEMRSIFRKQRIALKDIHDYIPNSQGILIRDSSGETLGIVRISVFGDKVYLVLEYLERAFNGKNT